MSHKVYPSNLTDEEWQLIEPLLPTNSNIGHPREVDLRDIVNAIFYVQREGCRWRALPGDFPAWQTVYGYLYLWQKKGIWQQVHHCLREQVRQAVGKTAQPTAASIDSQSVKTTEKRGRSTATMRQSTLKGANALL
jgi:putative transposase